ncbi:recombinase family protein [Botrimarina hoheduenensis]|uniref:Recombinase n=1 Tax=Botrimarina hoheduenensis TaxID=2528000 RepID=A0A5C5VS95_9BACT|nr:recombinase family protein [Botrimarina hoheduenensis]TWT40631.1 Recombinase [Botrimarina hoheduenensis]
MSNATIAASLASPKLQSWHLERKAIVYVRQSTPQQVLENRESTERQYALVDRAVAFGWSRDQVDVIDDDQGMSGQSVDGRLGFQRLLAEVSLDRVGLVLGLEMSRLARSCKDWHQLLELCGIFRTLLGDQDGLYDPTEFNDRLLLGLKGTMSEAELHVLKGRMYQGRINKAQRGELLVHPPIGYVLNADKTSFEFDPDSQDQEVIRLIFAEFNRQGTIYSLLKYLAQNDIRIPVRPRYGPNRNQLEWHRPNRNTLAGMLHHPTYAGAYRYGQHRTDPRKKIAGRRRTGAVRVPLEESLVLIKDRFPAYLSWEQFEKNQQQLENNQNRAKSMGAPREGPSLLGGLVYCGRCGARLMVTYSGRAQRLRYQCGRGAQNHGEPLCLGIVGRDLDRFVTERVFAVLQPASLELCLTATDDLEQERQRLDQHWRQRLERSAYEADRAERQFQAVEPENRLVARTLEKKWEAALRDHERCEAEYDDFKRAQPSRLTDEQRELVKQLSQDIPAFWEAPTTTPQDRQKIVRQLIDRIEIDVDGDSERTDITLTWAGGFTSRHRHNRTVIRYAQLSGLDDLVARIVELKKTNKTLGQVAEQLNQEGYRSVRRCPFTAGMLSRLLRKQGVSLPCRSARNSDALGENEWWLTDLAEQIGMPSTSHNHWRIAGWVKGRKLPGLRGRWILWADNAELQRLKQLRATRRRWSDCPYPQALTTPTSRDADASSS